MPFHIHAGEDTGLEKQILCTIFVSSFKHLAFNLLQESLKACNEIVIIIIVGTSTVSFIGTYTFFLSKKVSGNLFSVLVTGFSEF